MAVCEYCNQEMRMRLSCTLPAYDDFADGHMRMRVPVSRYERLPCADCSTPPGGFHHPGCELEVCPACGDTAQACCCTDESFAEVDDSRIDQAG